MRLTALSLLMCAPLLAWSTELPPYFAEALARFSSDAPRGWAYTLTTTREGETSVERYDPSRPHGGEWSLIQRDGRAPTAEEIERYLRFKASSTPPTARATFQKGDLDLATFELLREDAATAVYRGRFRQDLAEPLLSHLAIELEFTKDPPAVRSFVLRLISPFSPALGVKMTQLEVQMSLSAPTAERPSLPQSSSSRFRGRLFFFKTIAEDVQITYSDFAPVVPQR